MKRKTGIFVFICILLLALPFGTRAEDEAAADLIKSCTLDVSDSSVNAKTLEKRNKVAKFAPGESFSVSWTDEAAPTRFCLKWQTVPENVTVSRFDAAGRFVARTIAPKSASLTLALEPETRKVTVRAGEAGMQISYVCAFGEGELPEPFHEWIETPKHLDYLLISTHPDDDVLYLGSVVPVYGAEQGYVGSIAYVTCTSMRRMAEAENGAWTMGLRYRPLFLGYEDVSIYMPEAYRQEHFPYDALLKGFVRLYREYRPAVVFAQDQNGEYGHWQHIMTSKAATEALTLAADASYDPESAEEFGVWQVQKVFLHLYPENKIAIDALSPLSAFDGCNAVDIAKRAFKKHETQQGGSYTISADCGPQPLNLFGMSAGAVPVGEDVFDNIAPELLSTYMPPTPEPTEAPTEAPTPDPTDAPTPAPTAAPTEASTQAPVAEPTPATENAASAHKPFPCWIPVIAAALIAGGLVLALRKKK